AGSSNYEDGQTNGSSVRQFDLSRKIIDDSLPADAASTGPLALGDMDGDGNLDLFVGGRVIPGRYSEASSSRIFRWDGTQFKFDSASSKALEHIGLVSAVVWSDLTGDGFPELVLACEWGAIQILRNEQGKLTPWDAPITH